MAAAAAIENTPNNNIENLERVRMRVLLGKATAVLRINPPCPWQFVQAPDPTDLIERTSPCGTIDSDGVTACGDCAPTHEPTRRGVTSEKGRGRARVCVVLRRQIACSMKWIWRLHEEHHCCRGCSPGDDRSGLRTESERRFRSGRAIRKLQDVRMGRGHAGTESVE